MLDRAFVLALVAAASFLACGGKIAPDGGSDDGSNPGTTSSGLPVNGSCPPVGTRYCPSDDPASANDIAACNDDLADPTCGGSYKAFLACAESHVSCTAYGTTDGNAIDAACNSQLDAYEQCVAPSPPHPQP